MGFFLTLTHPTKNKKKERDKLTRQLYFFKQVGVGI